MRALTHESGFVFLAIAAATALAFGLALAASGTCWW